MIKHLEALIKQTLNKSGKLQIKYKILKFTRLNITSKENLKFGLSEIK